MWTCAGRHEASARRLKPTRHLSLSLFLCLPLLTGGKERRLRLRLDTSAAYRSSPPGPPVLIRCFTRTAATRGGGFSHIALPRIVARARAAGALHQRDDTWLQQVPPVQPSADLPLVSVSFFRKVLRLRFPPVFCARTCRRVDLCSLCSDVWYICPPVFLSHLLRFLLPSHILSQFFFPATKPHPQVH